MRRFTSTASVALAIAVAPACAPYTKTYQGKPNPEQLEELVERCDATSGYLRRQARRTRVVGEFEGEPGPKRKLCSMNPAELALPAADGTMRPVSSATQVEIYERHAGEGSKDKPYQVMTIVLVTAVAVGVVGLVAAVIHALNNFSFPL